MSDLFKSALNYIGSSSSSTSRGAAGSNGASTAPSIPAPLTEVIKLSGENVRLLKLLAEGGCSYVYGGQFGSACEIIAVKKIPCQADMEDRILSEIKYMNGFQHRNIAKYFGYNKVNNTYWIGLEYCSTLRLPVPIEQVGIVFGHIVSGVEYMHKQGITHWDLKIENCMLGRDQMIKLIDFGSADTQAYDTTDLSAKERNIMEDALMRFTTPMYRPPEILDLWSGLRIDHHVDLWALGCIIYYLAHSEHPFSDSNKLAIINCKYAKKPSVFSKIIEGLLVVNPEGRWTLGGVLHELQSMGIDVTSKVPMYFEEFQMPLQHAIAANVQSSSLLNSIKGGAESLFKNIKESSTRIYANSGSSGRPEQAPIERENPMAQQRPPPPRPAPPKSPVPQRPPPPTQLTGERERVPSDPMPPPRPAQPRSQPATAFDLISDIESSAPVTVDEGAGSLSEAAPGAASLDLLGEFKSEIDLLAGTSSVGGFNSGRRASGPTKANDLDDLFGFSPMPPSVKAPTQKLPAAGAEKVDLFGSLLSDLSSDKTSALPTSSSFNHLGTYKEESKREEMVKSTPNLNDMFSDLLLSGEGLKPTPVQPVKIGNGGVAQATPSNPNVGGFANFGNVPVMQPAGSRFSTPNQSTAMGGMSSGPRPTGFPASGGAATSGANYRPSWTPDMASVFGPDKSGIGVPDPKVGGKKLDLNAAFGELLNEQGFTGSSAQSSGAKTINDMRRTEIAQTKTPEQMKVMDWVEGKRKNIRALLSSLHTVTWEGCTWKPANMSLMVEPNDVKKVYRRACLAIHPDKQRGEDCEELAKLIFVELNEAYTHFESELR